MKQKLFYLLFCLMFLSFSAFAQEDENGNESESMMEIPEIGHAIEGIGGNLNFTSIGDQTFFGARLTPDVSFGKLGFGLDVPLLVNLETGKIRIDEYKDGVGPLRLIKYVRWGIKKQDPVFIRIGELRDAQLGFGILISDYNNSISYEKRKLGAEFDIVIKKQFGLEVIYSDLNLTSFNLLGIRPYIKPFGATGLPIIKTFEIGVGYVTDHDKTYMEKSDSIYRYNYFLDNGINSFSADMGFYIINWKFLKWNVYAQAGYMGKVTSDSLSYLLNNSQNPHLMNYTNGMGWSIGSDFNFHFLGNLLKINARAERFWHSDYFVPRFYSFAYELNKDIKIMEIPHANQDQGMYFKLGVSVLDKIVLHTNIIFHDKFDSNNPAELYFGLDLSNLHKKLTLYTSLYQAGIKDFSDIVSLRDESLFETLIAWQIYEVPVIKLQFIAGVDFKWTYSFLAQDFEATHYFSPFFKINFPMNGDEDKEDEENKD